MDSNQPESGVNFRQQQAAFTAYIRNPNDHPVPKGIKPERMAMYAELLFNNIENFLSGNFPVLKKIHSSEQWLKIVRDFFAEHHCQTPYFAEIPQEFLTYLQEERKNPDDFPFLLELAHYEWVEMALALTQEQAQTMAPEEIADLNALEVAVSPLAWPLVYRYPVQRIAPTYIPLKEPAELTFMMVYRDQNDEVQFLQITPVTYQLLDYLQSNPGRKVLTGLTQLAQQNHHPNVQFFIDTGLEMLRNLARKGIIIKNASPE